ncbi:MAG: hypothetical protein ABSF44_16610 [Candidatus Bathyarchaeia archaeon]
MRRPVGRASRPPFSPHRRDACATNSSKLFGAVAGPGSSAHGATIIYGGNKACATNKAGSRRPYATHRRDAGVIAVGYQRSAIS